MLILMPTNDPDRKEFLAEAWKMHDNRCLVCKMPDSNCTISMLLREIEKQDQLYKLVYSLADHARMDYPCHGTCIDFDEDCPMCNLIDTLKDNHAQY